MEKMRQAKFRSENLRSVRRLHWWTRTAEWDLVVIKRMGVEKTHIPKGRKKVKKRRTNWS